MSSFYPQETASEGTLVNKPETTRQRLERSKKLIETKLENVNRALELLDKNPELEEFQDVLSRVACA